LLPNPRGYSESSPSRDGRFRSCGHPVKPHSEGNQLDKIILEDLRVEAIIGIWEWERRIRQTVSLDLEMAADVKRAAAADEIEAALDYKRIAKELIRVVETSEFKLVETLAETLARIVVTDFGVPWVRLSVSKPGAIEGSRNVGVVVERSSDDYA
jgi:dihydroneopterin aldolase